MIVNKQCACGQSIEFEAEELARLTCPACGRSLNEQFARKPAAVPPGVNTRRINSDSVFPEFPSVAPSPKIAPAGSPQAALDAVRAASCYKTLRALIRLTIGVGYVICLLLVLIPFTAFPLLTGTGRDLLLATLSTWGLAILLAILLTALKEALLLGIDAVDILAADRADRLTRERRALDAELSAAEHARTQFESADK